MSETVSAPLFEIDDLHVSTAASTDHPGAPILNGVSLTVQHGEVHALMGPNGCGKSTLASVLLGASGYEVTGGQIRFNGDDIIDWGTDVRGKAGLFLAFGDPEEIAGLSVLNFLHQSLIARRGIDISVLELRHKLLEWMQRLDIDEGFIDRPLNEGFSTEEKKRNEILQMAILEPEMAILDETHSGLGIDVVNVVTKGIQEVRNDRPTMGTLAITRNTKLFDQLSPDRVHVMIDGKIAASGGDEIAQTLQTNGYESFK